MHCIYYVLDPLKKIELFWTFMEDKREKFEEWNVAYKNSS